jgi:hypothetical protein
MLITNPLRRHLIGLLVVATTALAGCAADGETSTDGALPTSTTVPTTGIDFVAGSDVDLGGGWKISPCESGPPLFCARLDGETQAVIEIQTYKANSYLTVKRVLEAGGTDEEALRAEAQAFVDVFKKDRPVGCGAGYDVEPIPPTKTAVGGHAGILYGFDGKQNGKHVERALLFSTIVGADLHIISMNAIDDDTCMDDGELAEFTIAELTVLEPKISRAIAAATLPDPT